MRMTSQRRLLAIGVGLFAVIGGVVGVLLWQQHRQTPGRNPVLDIHQAFADRLRSGAADPKEVRELTLPSTVQGDALLALALSEDASLLALATRRRVLCLSMEDQRW